MTQHVPTGPYTTAPAPEAPVPTTAPPPRRHWSDLQIDPPKEGGMQQGDHVLCWKGEAESPMPFLGIVLLVGQQERCDLAVFPTGQIHHNFEGGAFPHDDPAFKGIAPQAYRYKPARATAKIQALEDRCAKLEDKLGFVLDVVQQLVDKKAPT